MVQKFVLIGLMSLALNAKAETPPVNDTAYYSISNAEVRELGKDEAEAAVYAKDAIDRTFSNDVGIGASGCDQSGSGRMFSLITPIPASEIPGFGGVTGTVTTTANTPVTTTTVPKPATPPVATPAPTAPSIPDTSGLGAELDQANMVLDKIINLGKKVWNLIDQGKPVVNIKTDVATALPQGAKCWADLQNWQVPKYKVYNVSYKNAYGVTVVNFTYRVLFLTGGTVNGKGQYIGYASVEPLNVNVLWGFHFNVEASAPTVYNMASKEDPIAGMNLQIKWTLDPILGLQHQEQTKTYFITGRGEFRDLQ